MLAYFLMDTKEQRQWNIELMENERQSLARHKDLITEIKRIPHLPLKIPIDMDVLTKEASLIQSWSSHQLHANKNLPNWYYEHHKKSYLGQCLVDYTEHADRGMLDVEGFLFQEDDAASDEHGRLKFFDTKWGQLMPKTLAMLRQMSSYLNRTRIINTQPGGGIFWHSHHNGI